MSESPHLLSPKGFRAAAVYAGIKSRKTPDVAALVCDAPNGAVAAAVFTTNKVCAAPVAIGRAHLRANDGRLRGVVVNAGNANACTGKQGERDAKRMCSVLANHLDCDPKLILPSSTGIIGHLMPMEKLERGIDGAFAKLGSSSAHAMQFADAILTTDTKRKTAGLRVKLSSGAATLAGACKGSGMIGPRMSGDGIGLHAPHVPHATMLAYITTDVGACAAHLQSLLNAATDRSFNAVTVDDHTSTNDTAVLLASGLSGATLGSSRDAERFAAALDEVCQSLAYQIAADGEGATKVVRIDVTGARSDDDAKLIARSIANSPLVKCAMNGNDPNWGRIVSAAGYCDAAFDPDRATLTLQHTRVFRHGRPIVFDANRLSKSLAQNDVVVALACDLGGGNATMWTCDLSSDYVRINADYHT